jgi:hypothetical protein
MDLNWFWEAWYFDFGYTDLSLEGLKDDEITVINEGGRPLACELYYTMEDGSEKQEIISPAVWKDGNKHTFQVENAAQIKEIKLKILGGSDAIADNNTWKR